MDNDPIHTITIPILDKPYHVKCRKSCTRRLQEAGLYLDEKMREIKDVSKLKTVDHIFLMAALNIADNHLADNAKNMPIALETEQRIESLQQKLTETLADNFEKTSL